MHHRTTRFLEDRGLSPRCSRGPRGQGWRIAAVGLALAVLAAPFARSAGVPPTRIMPLGDSMTVGDSTPIYFSGYRDMLYALLTDVGYNVDLVGTQLDTHNPLVPDPHHEGHGGYRIDQIDAGIDGWLGAIDDPDVVLLLVGTNDFWQNYQTSTALTRLQNLVVKIATLRPFARVLVASLPPRVDSATFEAAQVAFNATIPGMVANQFSLGRHIYFVDLHGVMNASHISTDGVHPNEAGYDQMADAWSTIVTGVITPLGTSTEPPMIVRATWIDLQHVNVTFNKPLEDAAANAANFSMNGGVSVLQAALDAVSKRVITLTTSTQTSGALYTISVTGVRDLTPAHNVIPAGSTVTVQAVPAVIPRTGWSLQFVDSEEIAAENGRGTNAFDGSVNTFWHTRWSSGTTSPPHEIQINLGATFNVAGFRYLPRQDGSANGRIGLYEFYVSTDGVTWGPAVATGTFANSAAQKEVLFTAKSGQYVRLRALSEVNGNPWTCVAELNVLSSGGTTNQAPDGTITSPSGNVTITAGQTVSFAGSGNDPDSNTPLSYLWNFGPGSGVANSTVQNPGTVAFNTAGTFTVTFTVSDALGLADPTPATRTITVNPPAANQAPNGTITSPSGDVTITVGQTVSFAGSGNDPDNNTPLSYLWNFGAGSGVANATVQNPGAIAFNTAGTYTVTFTVTDALGLADPTPATRTITVQSALAVIPRTGWSLRSVDSQETAQEDGRGTNAFDGNTQTFWHTVWSTGSPPPPHEIQINLGATFNVAGFRYLPRQDGEVNGRIGLYEFYVSTDGVTWGSAVATGTFANSAAQKEVLFTAKSGQYVRLRALNEVNGNPWTCVAELNVLSSGGATNQAPDGTITSPSGNVTITAGQTVSFAGSGNDPDNNTPLSYLWNFGPGSGVANSTVQNPGAVAFNTAGTFAVTFTVSDALGLADPTPATRTITVQSTGPTVIPRTGWTLQFVDSQETAGEDGRGINAFDGNTLTFWHTVWSTGSPPPPHEIRINLGASRNVAGFRYLPRQDGETNGGISQYEFYVSTDGVNWGTAVATGTFPTTTTEQQVLFTPKAGQYVRLRAVSEINGHAWTCVAELNVLQ